MTSPIVMRSVEPTSLRVVCFFFAPEIEPIDECYWIACYFTLYMFRISGGILSVLPILV